MYKRQGFSFLCKNRIANSRGYSTGGVALAFRKSVINLKKIDLIGNNYEVIFAVGTMPKFSRKFIAVCVYLPPSLSASTVGGCFDFIVDGIIEMKTRFKDPFIAVSGDFNGFDIAGALDDFSDLVQVKTGPTRDLLFTNFSSQISESGVISLLECDSSGGVPLVTMPLVFALWDCFAMRFIIGLRTRT